MSRCSSAEPPALPDVLSRSASAKQQNAEQYCPESVQNSFCATFPTSGSQQQTGTQADATADAALSVSSGQPASLTRPGAFQISAAKPSLLAQIQAVSQQEAPASVDDQTEPATQTEHPTDASLLAHSAGKHAFCVAFS